MIRKAKIDPFNYFNQAYFAKNIEKLRLLRNYLREHPNFDPRDYESCKTLRSEGLKIHHKKSKQVDLSVGNYIMLFGGVKQFLQMPVYDRRISHIVASLIYARKCNEEDGYNYTIESISISRSLEIICRLYHANVSGLDARIKKLRKWCRRSPIQIGEALGLFDEELSAELAERSEKDILRSVMENLRISLDLVCPPLMIEQMVVEEF